MSLYRSPLHDPYWRTAEEKNIKKQKRPEEIQIEQPLPSFSSSSSSSSSLSSSSSSSSVGYSQRHLFLAAASPLSPIPTNSPSSTVEQDAWDILNQIGDPPSQSPSPR